MKFIACKLAAVEATLTLKAAVETAAADYLILRRMEHLRKGTFTSAVVLVGLLETTLRQEPD